MGSNRNYVDDEIVAQLTLLRKVKQVWRRRDNCLLFCIRRCFDIQSHKGPREPC